LVSVNLQSLDLGHAQPLFTLNRLIPHVPGGSRGLMFGK